MNWKIVLIVPVLKKQKTDLFTVFIWIRFLKIFQTFQGISSPTHHPKILCDDWSLESFFLAILNTNNKLKISIFLFVYLFVLPLKPCLYVQKDNLYVFLCGIK